MTKPDSKLTKLTKELSLWLLENFTGITLYVDQKLKDRSAFRYEEIVERDPSWKYRLQFWTFECRRDPADEIHLAVTLGGDGTVLYTAWMFQHRVPPIVAVRGGKQLCIAFCNRRHLLTKLEKTAVAYTRSLVFLTSVSPRQLGILDQLHF